MRSSGCARLLARGCDVATEETLRSRIAEHEQAIAKARELLNALEVQARQTAQAMQEQANTFIRDIERREGARAELIALLQSNGQAAPTIPAPAPEVTPDASAG
jgi:CHASE3 domain sensor protein